MVRCDRQYEYGDRRPIVPGRGVGRAAGTRSPSVSFFWRVIPAPRLLAVLQCALVAWRGRIATYAGGGAADRLGAKRGSLDHERATDGTGGAGIPAEVPGCDRGGK